MYSGSNVSRRALASIVGGEGQRANDAVTAVRASHEEGVTDEFVEPVVLAGTLSALATLLHADPGEPLALPESETTLDKAHRHYARGEALASFLKRKGRGP